MIDVFFTEDGAHTLDRILPYLNFTLMLNVPSLLYPVTVVESWGERAIVLNDFRFQDLLSSFVDTGSQAAIPDNNQVPFAHPSTCHVRLGTTT